MVKIGELTTEQCESIFKNIEYIVENTDDWDTDSIPEIEFDGRMYEFVELEYSTEYEDGGEDEYEDIKKYIMDFIYFKNQDKYIAIKHTEETNDIAVYAAKCEKSIFGGDIISITNYPTHES